MAEWEGKRNSWNLLCLFGGHWVLRDITIENKVGRWDYCLACGRRRRLG